MPRKKEESSIDSTIDINEELVGKSLKELESDFNEDFKKDIDNNFNDSSNNEFNSNDNSDNEFIEGTKKTIKRATKEIEKLAKNELQESISQKDIYQENVYQEDVNKDKEIDNSDNPFIEDSFEKDTPERQELSSQIKVKNRSTKDDFDKPPFASRLLDTQTIYLHEFKDNILLIEMTNGKRFIGKLKSYDKFTIRITDNKHESVLIFKQGISSIKKFNPPKNDYSKNNSSKKESYNNESHRPPKGFTREVRFNDNGHTRNNSNSKMTRF